MASVISHSLTKTESYGSNGVSKAYTYTYVLTAGDPYIHKFICRNGIDHATVALNYEAVVETYLIENELARAFNDAEAGLDPDRVPVYQTQAEFDKALLFQMMYVENVHTFHASLPFFKAMELRSGANAGQRATTLGVTTQEYTDIANRYGDDEGVAFFLDNIKDQIWVI